MAELIVAFVAIALTVAIMSLLIGACHYLGIWAWTSAWLLGSNEEKRRLTKGGHFNANGYMISSESDLNIGVESTYKHYDNVGQNDLIVAVEESKKPLSPPQYEVSVPVVPVAVPVPAPAPEVISKAPLLIHSQQPSVDSLESERTLSPPELPHEIAVEHVEFPSNLKRAMSCDSVSSDTSVVLETLDETRFSGQLEISLEYEWETADLIVSVLQARDLVATDTSSSTVDSYVRVYLLPDKTSVMHTRVQKRNNNPVYKERFLFGLEATEVRKRALLFYVYSAEKFTNTLIGESELKLSDVDLSRAFSLWINLFDTNQRSMELGEIMFSLSYLPTAERLTVVVVKARNLRWAHSKESADPFIKVYLLQNGKKISKKKTSVKRDEKNPIFNEAMIFSVPANALQTIQLRLTVAEHHADGRTPSVGHVIVGSQATGKTLSHWNQMMTCLRKPIAMWHPLWK